MQDKADDVHAGVKSTALLFGSATKPWLAAFGASTIGLLGFAGGDPPATCCFLATYSFSVCSFSVCKHANVQPCTWQTQAGTHFPAQRLPHARAAMHGTPAMPHSCHPTVCTMW